MTFYVPMSNLFNAKLSCNSQGGSHYVK